MLHKLAIDPLWAIGVAVVFGSSGVTWLGWLDGLSWTAKFLYGIWAVLGLVLVLTIPQYLHGKSRASRRIRMSDEILKLIRLGAKLAEGTLEHTAWETKAETRLRKFDPIWANDFASLKYRSNPGDILTREREKLGVQLVSIREDKDIY